MWGEGGRKHERSLNPFEYSPEVSGKGLCTQVRRLGLSLAPGSARGAKERSEVRRPRCWGRKQRVSPIPGPSSRERLPALSRMVPARSLTPTAREACRLFSPFPLDNRPVAWRCERAGRWGLEAKVQCA